MSRISSFATIDPFDGMTPDNPGVARNLVAGSWVDGNEFLPNIPDPMTGGAFLNIPDTTDIDLFLKSLKTCPKSGLHNPHKNPQRYVELGQVCAKAAALLAEPDISDYFTKLLQRVMPKSWKQCKGEVTVTRVFLENFAGDGVRFLARGFSNPGDYPGQETRGYRWPFGAVAIVAPFNFPLEIPALQLMGALFMGNRPLIKAASTVCVGHDLRLVQFTGSSGVAERTSKIMNGAVRLEDAGFDWKVIGPDYQPDWLDYVAWQSDEDAYNASGQKCSAQSILFVHENWSEALLPRLKSLAERRKLDNLTLGPVLSWNNQEIQAHVEAVMAIAGTKLLFGGKALDGHTIPDCYGAYQATAVQVPLHAVAGEHFEIVTTEVFGPFQVVVVYGDDDVDAVLDILERMSHHLTAAVVSADITFQNRILGATVNGTSYCGMRARTTGAPQNHWFGPCGDPRGAGIGTPEAILSTWSGHREIVMDHGPLPENWVVPDSA